MMIEITHEIASKVLEVVDAGLVSGIGTPTPGMMCVEAAVCYAMGLPHGDEPPCVSPALRAFKIALNDSQWSSDTARASGMRRLALVQLGSAGVLDDISFVERLALMTCNKVVPRALRLSASMNVPEKHSKALEEAALICEAAATLETASDAVSDAASGAASNAARAASNAARAASDAARVASYAARVASYAARVVSYAARVASYAASDAVSDAASDAVSDAARVASDAASDLELSFVAEQVVQILVEMNAPGAQWLSLAPLG